MRSLAAAVLLSSLAAAIAADNGLGRTPPMGWRSWNCYHADVTQQKMEDTMAAMADASRMVPTRWRHTRSREAPSWSHPALDPRQVDGAPASLASLGYVNCGLDDNWQACGAGVDGSFHAADGEPIINKERFPDMRAMTDYGHALGLRVGWYMNNCICAEHKFKGPMVAKHMEKSVDAIVKCASAIYS